jgi:ribosomal protein S18 acetylase RimI-like enzyme
VVAKSELSRRLSGYDKHLGDTGIAVKNGFRDSGIGTEMMKTLVQHGKLWGLKALMLTVFANNARALHVYRKIGFVETGRIPKKFFKEGRYIDEVALTMPLE